MRFKNRPAAQDGITVWPTDVMTRTSEDRGHLQLLGELFDLALMRIANTVDLLESHDICFDMFENLRDTG